MQGKKMCLIDHSNTITVPYLNGSKLCLNKGGMRIFFNNLAESVSNVLQWQSVLHSFTNGLCDTKNSDKYNAKPSNDSGLVQNLQFIRRPKINRRAVANLHINSLRNKFKNLVDKLVMMKFFWFQKQSLAIALQRVSFW